MPNRSPLFISGRLTEYAIAYYQANGKRQIIEQTELLPVLIAPHVWRSELKGKLVLSFVDNEGAKAAVIRGWARDDTTSAIANTTRRLTAQAEIGVWFDRVPASSNCSDEPSRGCDILMRATGARQCAIELPPDLPTEVGVLDTIFN